GRLIIAQQFTAGIGARKIEVREAAARVGWQSLGYFQSSANADWAQALFPALQAKASSYEPQSENAIKPQLEKCFLAKIVFPLILRLTRYEERPTAEDWPWISLRRRSWQRAAQPVPPRSGSKSK